jgi:hypothetical protein
VSVHENKRGCRRYMYALLFSENDAIMNPLWH